MRRQPLKIITTLAIAIAGGAGLVTALASLAWRYQHDSPLMLYAGFLLSVGRVPYRDFFDMNMPGTYFVMMGIGRIFGWSDYGFRIADLVLLGTISGSTFYWMRQFGALPAFAAAIAFPVWYINEGPGLSMQREYIALVPFSLSVACAIGQGPFSPGRRRMLAGCLAGMAFLIKPQFMVLCLPVLAFTIQSDAESLPLRRRIVTIVAGIALPVSAMLGYLLWAGGLRPFADMAVNYWPLYSHMTGTHETITGVRRDLYIVRSTLRDVTSFYAPMAVLGLIVLERDRTQRRYILIGSLLLVSAATYPALSGQFWAYHWVPFHYVALCLASLAFQLPQSRDWSVAAIAPPVCLIVLLASLSLESRDAMRSGKWHTAPENGVADEVGNFLMSQMKPTDTVQPLDWTGGAVHGMLMARAPLATRFMYDFHFYHHVSSPYIRRLRREFIVELREKPPRFVIQVLENRSWPTGPDTTTEFPELQGFLKQHYTTVQQGTTYNILEKNGHAGR